VRLRPARAGQNAPASLIAETDPRSPASEAYRALRTNIQFAGLDQPCRCIVVTSATAGEGKTTSVANFGAVCFAISVAAACSVFFVSVEYRPNCPAWSESKFFKQSHCFPGDDDSAAVILCALAHVPRIQVSAEQDDFIRFL